jgi:hypothetical protein
MSPQGKQIMREQAARKAIANWQGCPLADLEAAQIVFPEVVFLLIMRFTA